MPEMLPPGPTSSNNNMQPRRGTRARPAVYDDVFEDNNRPPQRARRPTMQQANY
jgi:hypothetical protein